MTSADGGGVAAAGGGGGGGGVDDGAPDVVPSRRAWPPEVAVVALTINSVFIYHTRSHPCLPSRISRQSLAYL